MRHLKLTAALGAAALMLACQTGETAPTAPTLEPEAGARRQARVDADGAARPLALGGSAYAAAGLVQLPDVAPGDYPGLHNVYRLSDRIISGAEPFDEGALAQLADWGVKTILSVDGKAPDAETAEALGMRYVHVPIRYKGMTDDELAKITKTFRELEGPFYVHCFHGKHRGPAAAAVGRVAIDGLSRERALAEMREWCGTSKKYEGLYSTVATAEIPSAAETAALDFDFASGHRFEGLREAMIGMARSFDDIKLVIRPNGWMEDPAHPDIDALQSATQLAQLFRACDGFETQVDGAGDDYLELMEQGAAGTDRLVELLTECRTDGQRDIAALEAAYADVSGSCAECHLAYRNR